MKEFQNKDSENLCQRFEFFSRRCCLCNFRCSARLSKGGSSRAASASWWPMKELLRDNHSIFKLNTDFHTAHKWNVMPIAMSEESDSFYQLSPHFNVVETAKLPSSWKLSELSRDQFQHIEIPSDIFSPSIYHITVTTSLSPHHSPTDIPMPLNVYQAAHL